MRATLAQRQSNCFVNNRFAVRVRGVAFISIIKMNIQELQIKANEIRKVTAREVQMLAKNLFQNNKLNLALIGPFKDKTEFAKILKF